jgi:hypothetical protein
MEFSSQDKMDICGGKDCVHHVFYRIYRAMVSSSTNNDTVFYFKMAFDTIMSLKRRKYDKLFDVELISKQALVQATSENISVVDAADLFGMHAETIKRLDEIIRRLEESE